MSATLRVTLVGLAAEVGGFARPSHGLTTVVTAPGNHAPVAMIEYSAFPWGIRVTAHGRIKDHLENARGKSWKEISTAPLGEMEAIRMSVVEAEYDRYWREAGGMARVRRTASLYESFRMMMEFQIRKKNPGLDDRQVTIQVARWMYRSDKSTQTLIDQMEAASCKTSTSGLASDASAPSSVD